jgi:hypothetical protein
MDMTCLIPGVAAGALPVVLYSLLALQDRQNALSEYRPQAGVMPVFAGLALAGFVSGALHGILVRELRDVEDIEHLLQLGAVLGGLALLGGFIALVRIDRATMRRPKGGDARVVATMTRFEVFRRVFSFTFFSAGLTVLILLLYATFFRGKR